MRRLAVLALAAGLVWSVLPVAPAAVGAQTAITLSVVEATSGRPAITSLGEDSATSGKDLYLRASVPSAVTSSVTVTVSRGGTATVNNVHRIFTLRETRTECRSGDACIDSSTNLNVTIGVGQTSGYNVLSWKLFTRADRITEDHETITFSGTASKSGYTVTGTTLTITDQDRAIKVSISPETFAEKGEDETKNRPNRHFYDPPDLVTVGGVTNGVFTSSTSSTNSQSLSYTTSDTTNMRVFMEGGTAGVIHTVNHGYYFDTDVTTAINQDNDDPVGVRIAANAVSGSTHSVHSTNDIEFSIRQDQVVEPDEVFYIRLNTVPSGWTSFKTPITIQDANRRVSLTVDTDSEAMGDQDVLTEGDSGSGVSVSASFPNATSSQISSVTTVTLSAAAETPAGAGKATSADFSYAPSTANTITFPSRSVTASGSATLAGLTITDDAIVEGPETFLVGGSSVLGTATKADTVTIYDDDADVELEVSPSSVEEQAGAQQVRVTARFKGSSSVLASATDVAVTVAGEGGATLSSSCPVSGGNDACTSLTGNTTTISIPAGGTSASETFTVTVPDDSTSESGEKLVVSGTASVGGSDVAVESADLPIIDAGTRVDLSLHEAAAGEAALAGIAEDGEARTVRVKATAETAVTSQTTIVVNVGAMGGTTTVGTCTGSGQSRSCSSGDYDRGATTVDVTIASGGTSGTADVTITGLSDTVAEGEETIRFAGSATGFTVVPVDLKITEEITLTLSQSSVGESATNAGAATVTAAFSGASTSELTGATSVTLSFSEGENAEAADFTAPGTALTLSIPAGSISSSATALTGLLIDGDAIAEGAESIDIGGSATGFSVSGTSLVIADDDLGVTLKADTNIVTLGEQKTLSEGATAAVRVRAEFTTATTNALGSALEVAVTAGVSSPQSAAGGGVDFTAPATPVTVSIPTGQTQGAWTNLTGLSVADDAVTEPAETFDITGTTGTEGATVASDTLTIDASDTALEVTASPGTVYESGSAHTIRVTAGFAGATSSALTSATDVTVAVAAGDSNGATVAATCPPTTEDVCTDQTNNSFTISIPAGQFRHSGSFQMTAREDGATEPGAETVKITGSATVAGESESDTDTINVVDSGITLALAKSGSSVSALDENSGSSTIRVTATLPTGVTAPAGGAVVGLNVAGEATADSNGVWEVGEDYRVTLPSKPGATPAGYATGITISSGGASGFADVTIVVNDDSVAEPAKTILFEGSTISISSVDYRTVDASLTLNDDDNPPTVIDVTLHEDDGGDVGAELTQVPEGETNRVHVRVAFQGTSTRSAATFVPIVVGKPSGEATEGTDYETVGDFNVNIPAYQSSGTGSFDLKTDGTYNDAALEGPETLTVAGGTLASFTIGEDTLTILDDDLTVILVVTPDEVTEGDANVTLNLQAAYPGTETLGASQTVNLAYGGTASSSDYTAPALTDLTISANQNSATPQTITLSAIADDNIAEGDETLQITGTVTGFTVKPATLTIKDNDDPPTSITLTVSPSSISEGQTRNVAVTARFGGPKTRSQPTPVTITIPTSSDYRITAPLTTLTIPAESATGTGNFTIVITNDSQQESAERINISGTAAGFTVNSAIITIPANDAPAPAPAPSGGGGGGGGGGGSSGGGGGGGAPPPAAPPPAAPPPAPAEPVCQGRFCDEDGSVHEANIERIAGWRITLGCDATDSTKYCPGAQITRRQMAAFLHRAVSQRWIIQTPEDIEISDVPADAWYRTYAEWGVSVNAFALTDGNFNPGGVVTRADMAIMMIAAFPHLQSVEEPQNLFQDATGLDPAVIRAIEGMYGRGVTRGCATTPLNYCPGKPVTRAQMASFFVRAVNLAPAATSGGS